MEQQQQQQISQSGGIISIGKSDKVIRLGSGFGLRNGSHTHNGQSKVLNRNMISSSDSIHSNGATVQFSHSQQQQQSQQINTPNQLTQSNPNYFLPSNSPHTNLNSQQIFNPDIPSANTITASQTQQGFFRRKINLKMSQANLKTFLNKTPNDMPIMIKSSKNNNNIMGTHMSQGNIQYQSSSSQPQLQYGNYFSSQQSLPCPSIGNSSNAPSPQTQYNSVMNSLNNSSHGKSSSTFSAATATNPNNNFDARRSINFTTHGSIFKSGDKFSHRGKRFSCQPSKNTSLIKQSIDSQSNTKKKQESDNQLNDPNDNNEQLQDQQQKQKQQLEQQQNQLEDEEEEEEYQCGRNLSMTKNTIANQSHNTESTNATAQMSHHHYPSHSSITNFHNLQQNHHYFDAQKLKSKQSFSTTSQTNLPSSSSSTTTLYVKKKLTEAKQYSNQVRQQIFEKQDQEEEENFLELCETLKKINYD